MPDTTHRPACLAADASGWSRELPTLAAARRAALARARLTGAHCFAEGDSEPVWPELLGGVS